ncbi:MAG TPA: hypothetical protein VJ844_08630, partial [Mucilaginibacter sp.]|nr:hypothetical protein [Mucilaginibacter sp.]
LGRDIAKAPGIKSKVLYIIMPPGWSHTGDHKMAHLVRREYFQEQQQRVGKKAEGVESTTA